MNLEGRRQSSNVDDRRGRSVAKAGGIGLGGIIIIGIITLIFGGDPSELIQQAQQSGLERLMRVVL